MLHRGSVAADEKIPAACAWSRDLRPGEALGVGVDYDLGGLALGDAVVHGALLYVVVGVRLGHLELAD